MRYEVNVSKMENPSGSIRGFASVVFNNCFKVGNIAIVAGREDNLFVSMLRYATSRGDEDYKDVCNPITKEFRAELYDSIMEAFDGLEPGGHTEVSVNRDEKNEQLAFNVKVTPFEREDSNIRGLARIYLEDSFVVSNVSLLEGKKGLFVAMPSYKTKHTDQDGKSEYQDICYPVTKAFRERLYGAVMDAYEMAKTEQKEQKAQGQQAVGENMQNKEMQRQEEAVRDTPFR